MFRHKCLDLPLQTGHCVVDGLALLLCHLLRAQDLLLHIALNVALLELKERACNMRTGCFRLLDRTLSNVRRILADRGEDTVTVKIIEQASAMMML